MTISHRIYLVFKFFNSMFSGLSIGTVFVIYAPLNPSVYSVGGILLAVATMVIATFYTKLIQVEYLLNFFMCWNCNFDNYFGCTNIFIEPTGCIHCLHRLSNNIFFGSYLVRCETLLLGSKKFLSKVDIFKQLGYLMGLGISHVVHK